MHLLDILPWIIWSGFLGLVIGNFATSPIYRLPRNESLFIKNPNCDSCHAPLKTRDLFPVFSWLLARGRCRYCGAPVPVTYAAVEALTAFLFVLCYLKYGFDDSFVLVALGMTTLLMLTAMLYLDNFLSGKALVASLVLGMLYRTLQDHTIFNFAGTAYGGLIAGFIAWKISKKPVTRDLAVWPDYLKLLVLAGVWLHWPQLLALLLVLAFLGKMPLKQNENMSAQLTNLRNRLMELMIIAGIFVIVMFA